MKIKNETNSTKADVIISILRICITFYLKNETNCSKEDKIFPTALGEPGMHERAAYRPYKFKAVGNESKVVIIR